MSLRQQLLEIRDRQVQLLADIDQLIASVPPTDNSPTSHTAPVMVQSTLSPLARKCVNAVPSSDLDGMDMSASSLEYLQRYNLLPSSDQRAASSSSSSPTNQHQHQHFKRIADASPCHAEQGIVMKPCYLTTDHSPFKENDEATRILNCDDIRRLPKL